MNSFLLKILSLWIVSAFAWGFCDGGFARTFVAANDSSALGLKKSLDCFFEIYKAESNTKLPIALENYVIDSGVKTLHVYGKEGFGSRVFDREGVARAYDRLRVCLDTLYADFDLKLYGRSGVEINRLIPNLYAEVVDTTRLWKGINHEGEPWVRNISRPFDINRGMEGVHLAVWPSHGRYFDFQKKEWLWQRPYLYATTEDLFTRSIVVPFLIPMIERAGGIVFCASERDCRIEELIVDNDSGVSTSGSIYVETVGRNAFDSCGVMGFGGRSDFYESGRNPHLEGTARVLQTSREEENCSSVCWMPEIEVEGEYALYVTYPTMERSVSDAVYIVRHRNVETRVSVNQRIGGGMWVYLGTFDFGKGRSIENSVTLTSYSSHEGVVCADAIRLGGGMGNMLGGETLSGLPRYLEGALYYARWLGMPFEVYNTKDGRNDYADDINVRSNSVNYIAGGSAFLPAVEGLGVPLELSLAFHSDAGWRTDSSTVGTLTIYTYKGDNGEIALPSGVSRLASSDLASIVQNELCRDLSCFIGSEWGRRELYDRNYSECRKPEVPSIILELLSHQNFQDMVYGHDPNFKFAVARAVYKALGRYVSMQHGRSFVVAPLPVRRFSAKATRAEVVLSWCGEADSLEPSANPDYYVIYTGREGEDFDNGIVVDGGNTSVRLPIERDVLYRFKVAACNEGGESFPSEELSVLSASESESDVLVVNCFTRLSGPAIVSTPDSLGFDLQEDIGVAYHKTLEYCGRQRAFSRSKIGLTTSEGLGFSSSELEGRVVAGNSFDYPFVHAKALREGGGGRCSVSSCSVDALLCGDVDMGDYSLVDLIMGLQKDCGKSSVYRYKTFLPALRGKLSDYIGRGGSVFVSGSYISSDMREESEEGFTSENLCYSYGGRFRAGAVVLEGDTLSLVSQMNTNRYAVGWTDVITPMGTAEPFVFYPNGSCSGISSPNVVAMGFPFESVEDEECRSKLMKRILERLIYKY